MSTETINIVVSESGAGPAATNIRAIGEAAALSDKQLTDMLVRSGAASTQFSAVAQTTSAATQALTGMSGGASTATAALAATGAEAGATGTRLASLVDSSGLAVRGLGGIAAASRTADTALAATGSTSTATAVKLVEVGKAGDAASVGLGHVEAGAAKAIAGMHAAGAEAGVLEGRMKGLEATFIALGVALGAKELIELTDVWTNMTNQLRRLGEAQSQIALRQQAVFDVAQASRQPLEAVNKLYVNMAEALRTAHVSADEVVKVTKVLAQGAALSGKSVEEVSSAMNRLGISLREGDTKGRGFLQFLMAMPEIGEKVAVAMGFAAGERGFGAFVRAAQAGAFSTTEFVKKINGIGGVIAKEFGQMEVTASSAMTVLSNSFLQFIGKADAAGGVSDRLAHMILFLADHIRGVVATIAIITGALTAYAIATTIASIATLSFVTSFAGIAAIIGGAIVALSFLSKEFPIIGIVASTAFNIVVAVVKTAIDVFVDLYKYLTQTDQGIKVLSISLAAIGVVVLRFVAIPLANAILGWISAFAGFLYAIAPVAAALIGLIALYTAVRFATVAATQGIAAAKEDLKGWTQGVLDAGAAIKDKFMANLDGAKDKIAETHDSTDKLGEAIDAMTVRMVKFGDASQKGFQQLGAGADAMSIDVVRASRRFNTSVQSMDGEATNSASSIGGSFQKIGNSADVMGNQCKGACNLVKSSLGELISATDDWSARSGANFNKVAQDAVNMANSATSAMSKVQSIAGPHSSGTGATGSMGSGGQENLTGDWFGGYSTANTGSSSGISDLSQWYGATGGAYGISDIGWFANGGSFEVGGKGGTDSQLVQFMATPGERVNVETASQQSGSKARGSSYGSGDGGNIIVHMNVTTNDANSFRKNDTQIVSALQNKLNRVQSQLGGS
jgi:hypothetical protein